MVFWLVFLAGTVPWTVPALRVLVTGWRTPAAIQSDSISVDMGGFYLRVFLDLRLETMPYILPAIPPGGADRRAAIADPEAGLLLTSLLTTGFALAFGAASFMLPRLIPESPAAPLFAAGKAGARDRAAAAGVGGIVWVTRSVIRPARPRCWASAGA